MVYDEEGFADYDRSRTAGAVSGNEGVKYIFGIPGEENLDVMQALRNSSIQFITTRHEQGAAFMADVYGRLTGKAGVCLSTLGPGATNLVTGVADANSDGAPLVAITGQVDTNRMHITSHQFLDLVQMFTPITKRSKQIVRPDSINEIVRIAFKYAESEKPGAAHIDLPNDIAKLPVPEDPNVMPMRHTAVHQELTDVADVEKAAGLIFQAEHPVILAGHKCRSCPCSRGADKVCGAAENSGHQYHDGKGHHPHGQPVFYGNYGHSPAGFPERHAG